MRYHVVVCFGKNKRYPYQFEERDLEGCSADEARRWFDKEYADLNCEPVNPVGKVLIIDKILSVARAGSEQRFADGKTWATQFARYASLALGRDMVSVDVEAFRIGY